MNDFVSCIVAAGGSGTRMGADKNKLFLEVDGVAVIVRTLVTLEKCKEISEIIISAREEDIDQIQEYVHSFEIEKVKTIVKGGTTRAESVLSAVKEISDDCRLVMIHDGARPFVTEKIISDTIRKATETGAAACGVKPKCTLKAVNDNGYILNTIDREKTIEIQTPQVFVKELFLKMYSQDAEMIKRATDDCSLAEICGADVFVTDGSYENIKITTPEDILIAETFLRRG